MKCSAVVLGVVLLAATVSAQTNIAESRLPAAASSSATAPTPTEFARPLTLWAYAAPGGAMSTSAPALPVPGDPGAEQIPVYSVRPEYSWQLYGGYSFFNFYEVPNLTNLENGFDIGVTYFPHASWIGAEGDLMATFGSQAGCTSKFTLTIGGVKLRWQKSNGIQLFLHGLAGAAHFFPQTAYGGQNAFAYETGGGIDISRGHRRIKYRVEADAVGTQFFHSYQISPKISVGIVFSY
jgi:hypothetical protein